MRLAFVKTLCDLARRNKHIYLVTGDLGYAALEPFVKAYPRQYVNIGVAEQDLMGVAAGLALSGKIVFAYSIATFASMRALEQIRNDICYQNLPVRIVGVGGGFSYGHLGVTHYAIEDVALMRALPNMAVTCPGDPKEAEAITKFSLRYKGPLYIRLGKVGEPIIHKKFSFQLGKGYVVRDGMDCAIFVTGALLGTVVESAELLRKSGISCRVISMPTVKPIDKAMILRTARSVKNLITVEEHNVIGGLGSAVAEILAESGIKNNFRRLGIPDEFPNVIGSQRYMRERYGLSKEKLAGFVKKFLS